MKRGSSSELASGSKRARGLLRQSQFQVEVTSQLCVFLPEDVAEVTAGYLSLPNLKKMQAFLINKLTAQSWLMSPSVFVIQQQFVLQLWTAIQHDMPESEELREVGFRWKPYLPDTPPVDVRVANFLTAAMDIGTDADVGPNFRKGVLIRLQENVKSILDLL
jgi:hypothetical protein